MEQFSRSRWILGEKFDLLRTKKVIIFGIGGVGGYVAEALARTGIGCLALVDNDEVAVSNINRQIIALHSSLGKKKVEVMKERCIDINPDIKIETYPLFYSEKTKDLIQLEDYDYIVDAIDSVSSKLTLIEEAKNRNIEIISAMGAGNKLDPTKFEVADIYKTYGCPLAKVMRYELKKRNVKSLKTVFSPEISIQPENKERTPASVAFTVGTAGFVIAGEVIKDLINS